MEDEFGQWATDEMTGEQGYVEDEGWCFWTCDNNKYAWQSRPFKGRKLQKKVRAKERTKVDQQEQEERSLVKNKRMKQNCGQKKIVLGGPKENQARNAFGKEMKAFGKVDFTLAHLKRVQSVVFYPHKGKGKDQKGKGKEGSYPQTGFQPLKTPLKRDKAIPGNQTIGIPL